jgi:hypothetical protein
MERRYRPGFISLLSPGRFSLKERAWNNSDVDHRSVHARRLFRHLLYQLDFFKNFITTDLAPPLVTRVRVITFPERG